MGYVQKNVLAKDLLQTMVGDITANTDGETAASAETSVLLATQGAITLTLPATTGQSGWRIYRSASTGGEVFLTTIRGDAAEFIDDGSITPGTATPPTTAQGNVYGLSTPSAPTGAATTLPFLDFQNPATTLPDNFQQIYGSSTNEKAIQQFYPNFVNLKRIDVEVKKNGIPGSDLQLDMYEANALTNEIDEATSLGTVTVAEASIGGAYSFIQFVFATPVTLVKGRMYYIRLKMATPGAGDASNNYEWRGTGTLASHTGQYLGKAGNGAPFTYYDWVLFSFKTYFTGTLAAATYFYKITRITGFVSYDSFEDFKGNRKYRVLYSTGSLTTDNIWCTLGHGLALSMTGVDTRNVIMHILRDNKYNFVDKQGGTAYPRALSDSAGPFGPVDFCWFDGSASPQNPNTYRANYFFSVLADRFIFTLQGDPVSPNWIQETAYIGLLDRILASDANAIVMIGTGEGNYQVPPAGGANGPAFKAYSVSNSKSASGAAYPDSYVYRPINHMTNTPFATRTPDYVNPSVYEGNKYVLWALLIGDTVDGIRGTLKDIYVISDTNGVIGNLDEITISGATYKHFLQRATGGEFGIMIPWISTDNTGTFRFGKNHVVFKKA